MGENKFRLKGRDREYLISGENWYYLGRNHY